MSDQFSYTDAFKATREAQQKFDYFFMGVVLATVSLSLQVEIALQFKWLLFLSWIFWLISLAAGLLRLERSLAFLRVEADSIKFKISKDTIEAARRGNFNVVDQEDEPMEDEEIDNQIKTYQDILGMATKYKKKHAEFALYAYYVFKWSYFLGVLSFVVYRIVNA